MWVNCKAFIGIFSQTSGSTCEFWVNPVNFTFNRADIRRGGRGPRRAGRRGRAGPGAAAAGA
jgi:hypothetical protein